MGLVDEAILKYIKDTREVREGPQDYWYPSQLGGCDRQAVLKRSGFVGTDFDDRTLKVFWMGNAVHSEFQAAVARGLPEGYTFVGHELRVRDESAHVSGRLDSLVRRPDGDLEVIEYKSTRSSALKYGDLPKAEHILQLGIYCTFPSRASTTDEDGVETVTAEYEVPKYGRIVYLAKDTVEVVEFPIEITEELRAKVRNTLLTLDEEYAIFLDTGELPAPLGDTPILTAAGVPQIYKIGPKKGQPFVKQDWRVGYCPFLGTGKCCGDKETKPVSDWEFEEPPSSAPSGATA